MSVQVCVTLPDGPGTSGAGDPGGTAVAEVLEFAEPPPGLRDLRRFRLAALDDAGFLFALRSTEEPEVRLFVVPPRPYFPDYDPVVAEPTLTALGVDRAEALLLVVVHPGQDGAAPTANLLAPVVVDPATGRAVQVVLDGDAWPLRAPLTAAGSAA